MSAMGFSSMRGAVPDRIKCVKCKKNKFHQFFSNRQLDELLAHVKRNDNKPYPALKCKVCIEGSFGQKNEMMCQICLKWKSKNKFANSMRKTPDNAWCKSCKEIQGQAEPITQEPNNSLPPVSLLRRTKISSASDAFDEDDDDDDGNETGTNPFSSIASSVANLSLGPRVSAPASKAPVLLNMFHRFNPPRDFDDDDDWQTFATGTLAEKSSTIRTRSVIDEEDCEEQSNFSSRRVPPRDRTAPNDPDASVWQNTSMTKPRVAPGGKLPASSRVFGDGQSLAIGPDGLPETFDRMAYGDPTANSSALTSSVSGNRYTESGNEGRKSTSKFAKPAPAPKPTRTRLFTMDEPVVRVVPAPESDSESDFYE